ELLSDIVLTGSLFVLAVIDWESLLVDMRVVIVAMVLRLFWLLAFGTDFLLQALLGLLVGAGMLYLLGIIYETLRKRRGLGEGDPALLGLIGMWVGWSGLGPVLLVAAGSGIIIGGFWLLKKNQPLLHTPVPFGPFLCLGGLLVHLLLQNGWMPWHLELTAF
ncbi:MAG: A24 family peptidase, partial [SAR324 cluster bacterium]|nr:A24 family peptidase [SAR324 cluster bacterium]